MGSPHKPDELTGAVAALAEMLRAYLAERPELRAAAHAVAKVVLEASAEGERAGEGDGGEGFEPQDYARGEAAERVPEVVVRGSSIVGPTVIRTVPLMIGDAKVEVPVEGTAAEVSAAERAAAAAARRIDEAPVHEVSAAGESADLPDLSLAMERCELKAEACRFAAHKRKRLAEGASFFSELQPTEDDLRKRIKAVRDCYIPVLKRDAIVGDDDAMERLARAYENLGRAAQVAAKTDAWGERQARMERVCEVLARAQSALRKALEEAWVMVADTDQREAYTWLQGVTRVRRIFVPWMKADSPADPRGWEGLSRDVASLVEEEEQERKRGQGLRRIAYEAEQILSERGTPERHWGTLLETVEVLIASGLRPSDPQLRAVLAPIAAQVPAGIEPGAQARVALREALREGEAAREVDGAGDEAEEAEIDAAPGVLQEARGLLRGRIAVIIGGEERPEAGEVLRKELGLSELRWLTKRPHASTAPFENQIARPEVEVVFFLSKLSNKHDGPEIRAMCREHGKACVMLRSGYNPVQVAHQFLEQASGRFVEEGVRDQESGVRGV